MQLHIQRRNEERHLEADSLLDFINTAAQRRHCTGWTDASQKKGLERREFTGTDSLEDALELLRGGWGEGTARIVRGVDAQAAPSPPTLWPEWEYDVAGLVPDVAAYCAGAPECMASPGEDRDAPSAVIRLYIPGMVPYRIGADTVMRHAVAVATHIDAIQRSGRSVELIWIGCNAAKTRNEKRHTVTTVPIITAGRALSVAQIAAAYHPAMLRRLWFAVMEQYPQLSDHGDGFGPVRAAPEWVTADGVALPGPEQLADKGRDRTDADAVAYLGECLAAAGLGERADEDHRAAA